MAEWQGKRYWLVGASEGLGREVAKCMSRAGAEVIVSARSEDRLKSLVEELPGKASYVTVDVADMDDVKRAAAEVGQIDGMVYLGFGMQSPEPDEQAKILERLIAQTESAMAGEPTEAPVFAAFQRVFLAV